MRKSASATRPRSRARDAHPQDPRVLGGALVQALQRLAAALFDERDDAPQRRAHALSRIVEALGEREQLLLERLLFDDEPRSRQRPPGGRQHVGERAVVVELPRDRDRLPRRSPARGAAALPRLRAGDVSEQPGAAAGIAGAERIERLLVVGEQAIVDVELLARRPLVGEGGRGVGHPDRVPEVPGRGERPLQRLVAGGQAEGALGGPEHDLEVEPCAGIRVSRVVEGVERPRGDRDDVLVDPGLIRRPGDREAVAHGAAPLPEGRGRAEVIGEADDRRRIGGRLGLQSRPQAPVDPQPRLRSE
jgi:hypothetical protein